MVAPSGLVAILVGTLLFLLPPHSSIAAIGFGIGGVAAFALGMVRFAGGPWWVLIAAVVPGVLLFAALNVAGRGLALHLFARSESCQVAQREEVDTRSRYPHYGFMHTVSCPGGVTLTIRTDSTDRQAVGDRVRVLDDPGGLLEPDFEKRHNLVVDTLALVAALGLVTAVIMVVRGRTGRARLVR